MPILMCGLAVDALFFLSLVTSGWSPTVQAQLFVIGGAWTVLGLVFHFRS